MKYNYNILKFLFLFLFITQLSFSQDKEESPWSFEMGLSAVDLYPVGEDAPQNEYFDEFLNLNDHWNLGVYVGVTRKFTDNISFTAKGTINEISKWGGFGNEDESVLVDNLKYYALDGMINYTFGKRKLKPFFAVGGGYTWIEEGPFNTFSATGGLKNLIGAGTVNGSIGVKYLINDKFTVSLQTTYKHSFEDYLTKHWDHNLGVAYKLEKLQQATLQIEHTTPQETPWSFETGLSVVNLFPVGEESEPQGEYFDEFFNLNDHWNLGFYVGVTRHITNNLSISAKGITNEISKWGGFGNADESALVDNLKYYGLDGMINYSFGKNRLQPFLGVGGGYTWIEEGPFNTFSTTEGSDNLVGAGTLNGSVGVKYWISDRIGINLQTTYKHSFEEYLPKHWNHSLGLVYKVNKMKKVVEEVKDIDEDGVPDDYDLCPNIYGLANLGGCPDTDGDGIADKDDLCPDVAGTMEFGGCPDNDGDGFPDNKDNCPNVAGTDNGCPLKVIETPKEKPVVGQRKVYFYNASANLDENAKATLDEIATSLTTSDVNYSIAIEGHADSRGSDNYNYNLSLDRAKAIKDYLTAKNVPDNSITISGKGEKEPIASNDTEAGRALNRRVELTIDITAK